MTPSPLRGDPHDDRIPPVERIEHHTRTLDRNILLTYMADAKAAPVLALHATLAAIAVSQTAEVRRLVDRGGPTTLAAGLLLALYVLTSAGSFLLSMFVYMPRAPHPGARARHGHSLVYFDDIPATPLDEFRERSRTTGATELEEDILRQVHTVAGIAARKMRLVQHSLLASGGAIAAWLVLMVWARA